MKFLVVSAPYDDHHSTWVVDSKDVDHVKSLFSSNRWEELENMEVEELPDTFVERIEKLLERTPESLDDVYEYFQKLVDDQNVTLEQFSKEVVACVNRDRGSWSSYTWVEFDEKGIK